MKPYLIFDYDGTIVNSKEMWLSAFKKVMKKLGHPMTDAEIFAKMGPKTKDLIETCLPNGEKENAELGKEMIDKIVSGEEGLKLANLCSNVKETLELLKKKGYKMSLVTNSDAAFVFKSLKRFRIADGIWDLVITADDPFPKKEDTFNFLIETLELDKNKTFYIADRAKDVDVAKNAGIKSVIVSTIYAWDSEERARAAEPDFLIKDLGEIEKIIKKQV